MDVRNSQQVRWTECCPVRRSQNFTASVFDETHSAGNVSSCEASEVSFSNATFLYLLQNTTQVFDPLLFPATPQFDMNNFLIQSTEPQFSPASSSTFPCLAPVGNKTPTYQQPLSTTLATVPVSPKNRQKLSVSTAEATRMRCAEQFHCSTRTKLHSRRIVGI